MCKKSNGPAGNVSKINIAVNANYKMAEVYLENKVLMDSRFRSSDIKDSFYI